MLDAFIIIILPTFAKVKASYSQEVFIAFFDYFPRRVSISSQTEFEELNDQPSNRAKNKLLLEGAARPAKEENVK